MVCIDRGACQIAASTLRLCTGLVGAASLACAGPPPAMESTGPAPSRAGVEAEQDHEPRDSESVAALIRLAELERRKGEIGAEYALLARALEYDPAQPRVHARLAEISGPAPESIATRSDEIVARALSHPYDPDEALRLLELASRLYGEASERGRETVDQAKPLRDSLDAAAAAGPPLSRPVRRAPSGRR
jgi:hypothetical protein